MLYDAFDQIVDTNKYELIPSDDKAIIKLKDTEDAAVVTQEIKDNINPRKWVCVEAESVIVENVGDVVLFLMSDSATGEAIKTSFLALGK